MSIITELRVSNVKRLKAVTITPDGSVVTVGGRNGQGKTSALDSIMYALGGQKVIPDVPIRKGEKSATIELDISGTPPLKVVRRFTKSGSTVEVYQQTQSGMAKLTSAQAVLDALCGRIAFDPLSFSRMKRDEKVALLRKLAGIDTSDIDAEIKSTFDERTHVNRRVAELKAQADAAPHFADAPEEEVSVAALTEQLTAAQQQNTEADAAVRKVENFKSGLSGQEATVERLRRELESAEAQADETRKRLSDVESAAKKMERADTESITKRIKEAAGINAKVQKNREKQKLTAAHAEQDTRAESLTSAIEALRSDRLKMIAEANWPVDGLGFSDDGVTLNDLPLEQASSEEQLRLSMAIAMQMNPKFPVALIREGSLIDDEQMKVIAQMADAAGGQVWVERVGKDESCTVVIEDGMVESVPEPQELEAATP